MSLLFSPLTIRSLTLRNRIVVSPMCQYSAVDGHAGDWHLVHLGSRAVGGASLVMQEATSVSPEGRISKGDLGIYNDTQVGGFNRITSFIKEQGAIPGIQIAHAGRKASCALPWISDRQLGLDEGGWNTIAPSPLPYRAGERIPLEMSIADIEKEIANFRMAASRALSAGYQVLEIHAAHGYLINEFLSPLCNQRKDNYGGSFENRTRFLLEIIKEVQSVWPDELPLFVRISATDWVEGGWTIDDSVALSRLLKESGVDVVDTSTGGMVPDAKIPAGPNYQVPFAERIKKESGIITGAVGIIVSALQAEKILADNQADLVFMAREHLRDPYFSMHAAKDLGEDIPWPKQYLRAKRK